MESTETRSSDEIDCEQHFATTHKRNSEGRYIVELPFKQNHTKLGNSKIAAIKSLQCLERRLTKIKICEKNTPTSSTNISTLHIWNKLPTTLKSTNPFTYHIIQSSRCQALQQRLESYSTLQENHQQAHHSTTRYWSDHNSKTI